MQPLRLSPIAFPLFDSEVRTKKIKQRVLFCSKSVLSDFDTLSATMANAGSIGALFLAAAHGDEDGVKRLVIKQPSLVSLLDRNRNSCLHIAASHSRAKVIFVLFASLTVSDLPIPS